MRVELVIDELLLRGFDPHLRHSLADAVVVALTSREGSRELRTAIGSWRERSPSTSAAAALGPAVVEAVGNALSRAKRVSPGGRDE